MTRIRVFDHVPQFEELRGEILRAIEGVLRSGTLILGPQVDSFERGFADYLGGRGGCVGVNSGTDALTVALMALGVGAGDDVVTVANTAVPTVSAIRSAGARPIFCDIDPVTCLMDIERLDSVLTEKTRAVIPVHLFGNVVDVERIKDILGSRNIHVVEDCAQAHGAAIRGRLAGTMGDIGAFSFYPTKNLGACGDAGLCYSENETLLREMRKIRMYGFDGRHFSRREGINSRLDEIQAAVLSIKLRRLPDYLMRRRAIAERYDSRLLDRARRVPASAGVEHAYHLFVVRIPNRDLVRERLERMGIGTGIHYPWPIHLMDGYRFLGYREGSLPRTEEAARSVLSLPMYPELPDDSVDEVCEAVNEIVPGR